MFSSVCRLSSPSEKSADLTPIPRSPEVKRAPQIFILSFAIFCYRTHLLIVNSIYGRDFFLFFLTLFSDSSEHYAILSLIFIYFELLVDVFGVSYLPGFMGLNNLTCTDDLSVLLHALAHVSPFRDFWLLHPVDGAGPGQVSNLARQFGLVMRKMWSGGNFKSSVSPQELVQEISVSSQKRFCAGQRSDCIELLTWLLRQLFVGLGAATGIWIG